MSLLATYKDKLKASAMAKGFFTTLLGSGTAKVILVLATFIFTHLLSKDDFGSFSFVRNTLNVILTMCALNYVELLTKFTAEIEYDERSVPRCIWLFLVSLAICVCIGMVLLLLPDSTLDSITGESSLSIFFRTIGLLLPLFMLQPLVEAVFRGFKMFKLIGVLQTCTALLFVFFVTVGSLIAGVKGAISGLLVYYLIYSVISVIIFLWKVDSSVWLHPSKNYLRSESKVIWTMVLPVFFLSFIEAPVNWWSQVLMTNYDSMGSIGSMSAILQIRNILIIIPNYFFSTFITFQASMNAEGDHEKYFNYLNKAFWGCLGIGAILSTLMCVVGPFVLGLYGKSYIADSPALYIAMISFPLMMVVSLLRGSLMIKEHQGLMLVTSLFASVAQIAVMYICLPKGIDPVITYFWAQFAFFAFYFVAFTSCTFRDYFKR